MYTSSRVLVLSHVWHIPAPRYPHWCLPTYLEPLVSLSWPPKYMTNFIMSFELLLMTFNDSETWSIVNLPVPSSPASQLVGRLPASKQTKEVLDEPDEGDIIYPFVVNGCNHPQGAADVDWCPHLTACFSTADVEPIPPRASWTKVLNSAHILHAASVGSSTGVAKGQVVQLL